MQIIAKIKFGSHLYGTQTPKSDLDIKGVYIPSARDILLQNTQPMISESRPKKHGEKNTSDDVDYELYSLQRYLELLSQGQTVALDMLFAPNSAMLEPPSETWHEIKELLAPKIITKGAASFVKYCRQQANKYGIKGSRVAAARNALEVLEFAERKYGSTTKLHMAHAELNQCMEQNDFINIIEKEDKTGETISFFEVCGKKSMFSASIKTARQTVSKLVTEYGHRALAAERNEGIDWKALSHAVRVGQEALEFFTTGNITFPRPEADYLRSIKQGEIPYSEVSHKIENLLSKVENAASRSSLPNKVDQKIIDDFIARKYAEQVILND